MRKLIAIGIVLLPMILWASGEPANKSNKKYTGWIESMKTAPRGPFKDVKWFCNDGTILPPKAYACKDHGGGHQHGNYSDQTKQIRKDGYYIANIMAGFDSAKAQQSAEFLDRYNQLLLEKFLIQYDDGWIFRKAQFYRGAVQEEGERQGARDLLLHLIAQKEWITYRYLGLRTGARLLPHGSDTASVQKVRQMAASLAHKDKGFKNLRVKIHGSPDAGDAESVRKYAKNIQSNEQYLELAEAIDQVYKARPLSEVLKENAKVFTKGPWLKDYLNQLAEKLQKQTATDQQYKLTAQALYDLRDFMVKIKSSSARLRILDLSLKIESENFKASTELRKAIDKLTRKQRLDLIQNTGLDAYGTGVINKRSYKQIESAIKALNKNKVDLDNYAGTLNYLTRVPGWGTQSMRFQFYESMQKLGEVEPLVFHFIQDQLRGSTLLFFSQVLNDLTIDMNQLSGVKHSLFGKKIGVGFNALNPGLVRGKLHTDLKAEDISSIRSDGIYVLPETVSDLPPLAGIITAGEGNPLSHVQLLARNLGIPNITINESLIPELKKHNGQFIVMAVSPAGLVQIEQDSKKWREFFGAHKKQEDVLIRPDLKKLDVKYREYIDLTQLRAEDSGRIVGPKAAKLAELKHIYPDKVTNGLAIPFGIFKHVILDKPYKNSSKTVFDWMVEQYGIIDGLKNQPAKHEQKTKTFRKELYDIIINTKIDKNYVYELRKAITKTFGNQSVGVFLRSDTNVEDLPGFTGAGLNLTLPNVIGFDNLLKGINQVWASPFTKRAFAWRQSHMEHPEHVYPSILILRSIASDKSGVLVTQDIDTGNKGVLSIAVNEGVGGAVDGQSSESLRVKMSDASVTVLATATAPTQRQPANSGGLKEIPVSGSETILKPDEIKQLIQFSKELPDKFPSIVNDAGQSAPADVEFGFVKGELNLFQIRPFLDNKNAQKSSYLIEMDQALKSSADIQVDLNGVLEL